MKIDIIVLASGMSKRFGKQNKLFYKISGVSMIERTLKLGNMLKKKLPDFISELVVVSCYDEIYELAKKYNYKYILNLEYQKGISESIHLGVKATNNYMMFLVSDEPYLKLNTLEKYVREFEKSTYKLATLSDEENNLGNPCIFSRDYEEELLSLIGDKGGKKIILNNLDKTFIFKVESKELVDIDYL